MRFVLLGCLMFFGFAAITNPAHAQWPDETRIQVQCPDYWPDGSKPPVSLYTARFYWDNTADFGPEQEKESQYLPSDNLQISCRYYNGRNLTVLAPETPVRTIGLPQRDKTIKSYPRAIVVKPKPDGSLGPITLHLAEPVDSRTRLEGVGVRMTREAVIAAAQAKGFKEETPHANAVGALEFAREGYRLIVRFDEASGLASEVRHIWPLDQRELLFNIYDQIYLRFGLVYIFSLESRFHPSAKEWHGEDGVMARLVPLQIKSFEDTTPREPQEAGLYLIDTKASP
jgi:hypothetical protein